MKKLEFVGKTKYGEYVYHETKSSKCDDKDCGYDEHYVFLSDKIEEKEEGGVALSDKAVKIDYLTIRWRGIGYQYFCHLCREGSSPDVVIEKILIAAGHHVTETLHQYNDNNFKESIEEESP